MKNYIEYFDTGNVIGKPDNKYIIRNDSDTIPIRFENSNFPLLYLIQKGVKSYAEQKNNNSEKNSADNNQISTINSIRDRIKPMVDAYNRIVYFGPVSAASNYITNRFTINKP